MGKMLFFKFVLTPLLVVGFNTTALAERGDTPVGGDHENQLLTIKELTEQGHYLEAIYGLKIIPIINH